jgi:hypothetical protein
MDRPKGIGIVLRGAGARWRALRGKQAEFPRESDSLLEEAGFEPSVPHDRADGFRLNCTVGLLPDRDRGNGPLIRESHDDHRALMKSGRADR